MSMEPAVIDAAEVSGGARSRERPWRRAVLDSLAVLAVTRLLAFIVAWAANWMTAATSRGPLPSGTFLASWNRWDAISYVQIAQYGYFDPRTHANSAAYFPGFPVALRGLGRLLGGRYILAALVANVVLTGVALVYLHRLADQEIGAGAGARAVWYLGLFPVGVFLAAGYTEPMFLAGAFAAFYYGRRGEWWKAVLPGALAVGSRLTGLFVVVALGFEYMRQRRWDPRKIGPDVLALVVAVLPLVAFMAYLRWKVGNPLQFLTDQEFGWGRKLVGPWRAFRTTWAGATSQVQATNWVFSWRVEIAAAALGAWVGVVCLLRRWWTYAVYTLAFFAVLLSSTWYFSTPRMLLTLPPLFLIWADLGANRWVHQASLAAGAALMALSVVVFTSGAWVS
ncbi:MAG: mannosyltransferase family protein [Actinomycetota bacterium]